MPEAEITETEVTETEEHVENPAAVLKKNRELLADLRAAKERTAALEEVARDLGLDDAALADPKAHVARRAEATKAARERERLVKEAALKTIASEQRIVRGDVEELLAKVAVDPRVTVDADGKVNLADVLERAAPKRAAPGFPDTRKRAEDVAPGLATWEELQSTGFDAVQRFASEHPARYAALRDDFEKKLAKGTSLR